MRMSTITLAAASAPGMAYVVSNRAPITSPPTCATGNRTLIASRTNRKNKHVPSCGRSFAENSSHQPAPATATVTVRTITTSRIPQPMLAIAWPTASRPHQRVSATRAAMPTSHAATPACLTIPPLPFRNPVCLRTKAWERRSGATRNGELPRRFDVERVRYPKPNCHLVGGAALGHDRRACGLAAEPFVLEEDVRRPLRRPQVARLRARSVGANAALGIVYRQPRYRRLRRGDAEIGIERRRGCEREPRTARQDPLRGHRNDGIRHDIGDDPVVTVEALPHLGARAQPRHPPILRKDARLACPRNVAQAVHRLGAGLFTLRPHELADWTDLVVAPVDQCDVQAVARTAEGFRRAVAAHGEEGIGAQPLAARALEQRLFSAFCTERDGPIIGRGRRRRRRRIGARIVLGCSCQHGNRQRSHKSGHCGAPIPHLPPSDFPARDNIDRQCAALVNMAKPVRTTRGLRQIAFAAPMWPGANTA